MLLELAHYVLELRVGLYSLRKTERERERKRERVRRKERRESGGEGERKHTAVSSTVEDQTH